jgi:hypothetical protein
MYYAAKIREATGEETRFDTWDSLLPFTLSGSKGATDKLAGLSGVRATDEFVKWTQSEEYKALADLPGGNESIMWLAPRTGEFTWQAWNLVKSVYGLSVPKTTEEKLEELFAAEGQYRDTQIRKDYDELIAALDRTDPEQRSLISKLEKAKTDERSANEKRNPYWYRSKSKGGTEYNQARLADSVKQMEIFIESVRESGRKMPKGLEKINEAIVAYRDFTSVIRGLGQKNAEKQIKAELSAQLAGQLAAIGQEDPSAKKFVETVLDTLVYGNLEKLDPTQLGAE